MPVAAKRQSKRPIGISRVHFLRAERKSGREGEGRTGKEREGEWKATARAPVDGINTLAGNGVLNKYQLTALARASVMNVHPHV